MNRHTENRDLVILGDSRHERADANLASTGTMDWLIGLSACRHARVFDRSAGVLLTVIRPLRVALPKCPDPYGRGPVASDTSGPLAFVFLCTSQALDGLAERRNDGDAADHNH